MILTEAQARFIRNMFKEMDGNLELKIKTAHEIIAVSERFDGTISIEAIANFRKDDLMELYYNLDEFINAYDLEC